MTESFLSEPRLVDLETFDMALCSFPSCDSVDALLFNEEIADLDFDFSDLDSTIGCTSENSYPSSLTTVATGMLIEVIP